MPVSLVTIASSAASSSRSRPSRLSFPARPRFLHITLQDELGTAYGIALKVVTP
jgi:hypothetical protein